MNTKITAEGWKILDPKYDLISGWIESEKDLQHDKFLPSVAVKNMRQGIVFDCGAHVGSHSLKYSQHLSQGSLVCIEASQTAFECLSENSKKFECHTTLVHACVSDVHGGHARFTVNEVNAGGSFMSEQNNGSGEIASNEVRTITLDGFCEDAGIFNDSSREVTFVKLDVEGFEYRALCGMKNLLRKFKPVLLIEFNSFRLSENGSDYKQIYDWLLLNGYSFRIVQPEAKGADLQYDVLAWPNPIEVAKVLPNG